MAIVNLVNKEDKISSAQYRGWISAMNSISSKQGYGNLISDTKAADTAAKSGDLTTIQSHMERIRNLPRILRSYPTAVTIPNHATNTRMEASSLNIIKTRLDSYYEVCTYDSICYTPPPCAYNSSYVYNSGSGGGGGCHSNHSCSNCGSNHTINGCASNSGGQHVHTGGHSHSGGGGMIHSDPKLKENIIDITSSFDALSKIKDIKFYSYDYNSKANDDIKGSHVDIGTLTTVLPKEIVRKDDLGYECIDINSYMNLLAKGIKELYEYIINQ